MYLERRRSGEDIGRGPFQVDGNMVEAFVRQPPEGGPRLSSLRKLNDCQRLCGRQHQALDSATAAEQLLDNKRALSTS